MDKRKTPHRCVRKRARNPTTPRGCRAAVVGLDGIGRQIALLLTANRVRALLLVDHRIVTSRIRRAEGYGQDDVDRMRAHIDESGNDVSGPRSMTDGYIRNLARFPRGNPERFPEPSVFKLGPLPSIITANNSGLPAKAPEDGP